MAGLVPAIHDFLSSWPSERTFEKKKSADGRNKSRTQSGAGHDDGG
jgi:hypothetical protein